MRVLLSGGGTAGHVYPALAVAASVAAEPGNEVAFVGAASGVEARLAEQAGVRFLPVRASGWDRARPWTLLTAVAVSVASLGRCLAIIRRERAEVVAGFGGYVSVPLALAALLRGIPLVLHEQNSVPGVANRVLSRWATAVCLTYDVSRGHLAHPERAVMTGNPVRRRVVEASRDAGRRAYGVAEGETLLLVFGGSRGARHLNSALVGLYDTLRGISGLRVIQIAGPQEAATVRESLAGASAGDTVWWSVLEYVDDMGDLLAAADLVVCRAGATTLAELSVLGRASVLVPYPFATDDHQTHNAAPFVDAGAAVLVRDSELDTATFGDAIVPLLSDVARRDAMSRAARGLGNPHAALAVAEVLRRVGTGHGVTIPGTVD